MATTCGDFGGTNTKGDPCRRRSTDGRCPAHREDASPGGRPTAYQDSFCDEAYDRCLLGATDAELAEYLGIAQSTLYEWKKQYPEFSDAIRRGKEPADIAVAHAVFQRATGAEWVEEQAFKVRRVEYDNGKRVLEQERVEVVEVTRRAPPDTTAGKFWLTNRSGHWRDKQDHEHSGPKGGPIEFADMSDEEVIDHARRVANRVAISPNGNGKR